jgi:two-component system chemotaxis response regulator CheY
MRQTVIIADDAQFMRSMLRDILTDSGWDVVAEAADGAAAVALFREHRPDLVMLDITMPGCDGVTACQQILAEDSTARIVMISALGQKEEVLAAIRAGAGDFVIKPFEAERVEETLRSLFARQP